MYGRLGGDYKSRMEGYSIGLQNGFMCPNDVRELEDLNPIPDEEGGNLYLVNGALCRLKDAGAFADKNTDAGSQEEKINNRKRGKS